MNSRSDAFASAVGARAGIASASALFALQPDAEAHKQAARLHAAVNEGNYEAVLDALSRGSELASERPLSAALLEDLAAHAAVEHHSQHLDDARALAELLLGGGEAVSDDVAAAEDDAGAAACALLRGPTISAENLRDEIASVTYRALAAAACVRLQQREGQNAALFLLGPERRAAFTDQLHERGLPLAGAIAQTNWRAALAEVCVPGLAEHNRETVREYLRLSVESALWDALGEKPLQR